MNKALDLWTLHNMDGGDFEKLPLLRIKQLHEGRNRQSFHTQFYGLQLDIIALLGLRKVAIMGAMYT